MTLHSLPKVSRPLEDIGKIIYSRLHVLAFIFQYASKEHLERSVEVVATATLVFVAIRSAAGVFVRRGRLGTSVTKVLLNRHLASFFSDDLQSIEHKHLCFDSNI